MTEQLGTNKKLPITQQNTTQHVYRRSFHTIIPNGYPWKTYTQKNIIKTEQEIFVYLAIYVYKFTYMYVEMMKSWGYEFEREQEGVYVTWVPTVTFLHYVL